MWFVRIVWLMQGVLLVPVDSARLSSSLKHDDAQSDREGNVYDFIIVGGGTSGCVLANRLSEVSEWNILVLEAGDEEIIDYDIPAVPTREVNEINWNFLTEANNYSCLHRPGGRCAVPMGKVLGGSSVINDMKYVRGSRHEFDEWAKSGCTGWNFVHLLDHFKMSEDNGDKEIADNNFYHATGGPLHVETLKQDDKNVQNFVKAFEELGVKSTDVNTYTLDSVTVAQLTQRHNTRLSTNEAFLKPIRHRKNLKVLTGALVSKLIINLNSKSVEGVKYKINTTSHKAYAQKEVILAAGTINSPKILMLSGIGPKQDLKSCNITTVKDLPVGKNYQDQVTMGGLVVAVKNNFKESISEQNIVSDFRSWFHNRSGIIGTAGISQVSAFVKLTSDKVYGPDLEFLFEGNYLRSDKFLLNPISVAATETQNLPLPYYNVIKIMPVILKPYSKGIVKLNCKDPIFSPPLIDSNMLKYEADTEILLDGIEILNELLNSKHMKTIGAKLLTLDYGPCSTFNVSRQLWKCVAKHFTRSLGRSVGTCKMGPDNDNTAVVDPSLKVHGIKGIRIVDASIMPTTVRGNLYATTVMIGEKGASLIREHWKKPLTVALTSKHK